MPDHRGFPATCIANPNAIVILLLCLYLSLAATAQAEIRVCSEGCGNSTIQMALNGSSSDETIVVESGIYREMPLIGKAVKLHGLDTGEGRPQIIPQDGRRIILAAYGAELRGFEIGRNTEAAKAPGYDAQGSSSYEGSCALEVVLPASIYLNNFAGKGTVCLDDAAVWNSSAGINYQFNSRVLRSQLGNYWADYKGNDSNHDGVGNEPYVLNDKNVDYYPLMQPVENYRIADEKETAVELIEAKVGEPFTISLPANPTTGYEWNADYDYALLKLQSTQFERNDKETLRVGTGGTSVFVFNPIGSGKTTIYFVYKRSWENIAADTRSFHVEISE